MTTSKALATLIEAAMAAGRSNQDIIGNYLNDDELNTILVSFIERRKSPSQFQQMRVMMPHQVSETGQKINYIRNVRAITGLALKDAKDFVEGVRLPIPLDAANRIYELFKSVGGAEQVQ